MRIFVKYTLIILLLSSCREGREVHVDRMNAGKDIQYTCPMHPQIVRAVAGSCPICGMDLVQVGIAKTNSLMLTKSQLRLGNITTEPAFKKPLGETVVVNGTLVANQNRSEAVSSRAAGRIEKLFVKETGQLVKKGEPLYLLYSESLLTLQQEYLLAKEQYESLDKTEQRYKSFLDAAERKLLLYGLTKEQVGNLTRNSAAARVTFLSPASGIATEIKVTEGQYVGEGAALYTLEDFRSLWVQAELYPGESSLLKRGDTVSVRASELDGKALQTRVDFLSPEYGANTQVLMMRAEINNSDLRLKPGQQVEVTFTHSSKNALAVPLDAVIRDRNGAHVYVLAGHDTFQPRMVQTGIEGFDLIEITDGLNEGDTVAVTGAYLLYSELVLKGVDPMDGHKH